MKRVIKQILRAGAIFMFLYLGAIVGWGLLSRGQPSDVCVVLGNAVRADGTPSNRLKARLDKARDVYARGHCRTIVVSGGVGKEGYDEAEVMKHYLVSHGVSSGQIIVDSRGVNTLATAQFLKRYCDSKGYQSVLAVSQYFHLLRTRFALRRMGFKQVSAEAPLYFEIRDLYSILREAVAFPVYLLKSSVQPEAAANANNDRVR